MLTWDSAWERMRIIKSQVESWLQEESPPSPVRNLNKWYAGAIEIRRLLIAAESGWLAAIEALDIDVITLPEDHPGRDPGKMQAPLGVQKSLKDLEWQIDMARVRAKSKT